MYQVEETPISPRQGSASAVDFCQNAQGIWTPLTIMCPFRRLHRPKPTCEFLEHISSVEALGSAPRLCDPVPLLFAVCLAISTLTPLAATPFARRRSTIGYSRSAGPEGDVPHLHWCTCLTAVKCAVALSVDRDYSIISISVTQESHVGPMSVGNVAGCASNNAEREGDRENG